MRIILLSILLTACLLTCGCSFATEFAVINNSDSVIDVEYVVSADWKSLDQPTKKPWKTNLSQYNAWFAGKDWKEVSDSEFIYDASEKKCRLKLAPGEVLRLTFTFDAMIENGEINSFNIESLRLNGDKGEVFYSGKRFYKQFERKDGYNYFITYK